ncbi:MAG: tRNA dihydrouridine(20/20a) synthase DusA [Candidatus Endonucleobacter bathymodioli]|uniref:tRNA-dihydrouridine(20/20a) synthase n=1 Tax=Candidatus Endonucleibacter bathymodioli TaxID=539814 RepID=A0AA90NM94_9GAMM|nr:tRNA dihydrouridine(20/20a) synthase DusA [Candidatus Endonucleobacter bathymodioli]
MAQVINTDQHRAVTFTDIKKTSSIPVTIGGASESNQQPHTFKTKGDKTLPRLFSVAPMMTWTDRHCRYFHRQLSQHALLYTEMITTGALIHGDRQHLLQHDAFEHPLALQLGGHDAAELARCARLAQTWGYQEVNLNVGCPSDRVQNGRIGACLMEEPNTIANGVASMLDVVDIPVTVKHRIGTNRQDSYSKLVDFVGKVADAGCQTFIVHARIAILEGLSPKQNRDIPPLKPDWVYQLKKDFPNLEIIINGGIKSLKEAREHMINLDGVMVGREAYQNPYMLAEVDNLLYGTCSLTVERKVIVERMIPYIESSLINGIYISHITRHMLGLYHGVPGAKRFRRHISENAHKPGAGSQLLLDAISLIE